MNISISPVEEQDLETVGSILCKAFAAASPSHPYGPAGYYLYSRWPDLNSPGSRALMVEYLRNLWQHKPPKPSHDPSLFVKAHDPETGKILGFMFLIYHESFTEDAVRTGSGTRNERMSQEDQDIAVELTAASNRICLEAVKELPHYEPFLNIKHLGVDTDSQGRGIGSILVKYAVDRADREHANAFVQSTEPQNAIKLYQKHGFNVVVDGRVPDEGSTLAGKVPVTRMPVMIRRKLET